ncbi:MAG TPA: DUF5615 family PIN-like protein [Casimicrobiaceae bacterium]
MKLLSAQNLSPNLVALLANVFPQSLHVRDAGLARADDESVWRFALERGFAIVTKDSDFQERSQFAGSAPKIVWIRRGNCSTRDTEAMLRKHAPRIAILEHEPAAGFLILL